MPSVNPQQIFSIVSIVLNIVEALIRNHQTLNQPVDPVLLAQREKLRKMLVDEANQPRGETPPDSGPHSVTHFGEDER